MNNTNSPKGNGNDQADKEKKKKDSMQNEPMPAKDDSDDMSAEKDE